MANNTREALKPYVFQAFPARMWDPKTKQSKVFDKEEDVPAGWLNHHPSDADTATGEPKQLSRPEIMKELARRKIPFDPKATTEQLYNLLLEVVEKET